MRGSAATVPVHATLGGVGGKDAEPSNLLRRREVQWVDLSYRPVAAEFTLRSM
jgi:hypothetical protein